MDGYHVYNYATDNQAGISRMPQYDALNHLGHLNSILTWKKMYGALHLFCNEEAKAQIARYDLLKYYDSINTDLLHSTNRMFWSYCKIQLAKHLADQHQLPFCIFDNDLWFRRPHFLDKPADIVLFHEELYDETHSLTHYPDPARYVTSELLAKLDWSILPKNSAIMCFKTNKNEIINKWYDIATAVVAKFNYDLSPWDAQVGTMFIEQRLLSTLAAYHDVEVATILPCKYRTHNEINDGSEWVPRLESSPESMYVAANIKHIWGSKRRYDSVDVRRLVFVAAVTSALDVCDVVREHPQLIEDCLKCIVMD
jgi:hypothetical protein